jgi:hypothetical protein
MIMKACESLILLLVCTVEITAYSYERNPELEVKNDVEAIVPTRITRGKDISGPNFGSFDLDLQDGICNSNVYEYTATSRDDLIMSYVVTNQSLSVELRYTGEVWIGLETSPDGRGKMVGSQAWIALPIISSLPTIYDGFWEKPNACQWNCYPKSWGNNYASEKLLNHSPVNGNGENVFIWAFGSSNTLGRHKRHGAFRIRLTPCITVVVDPPEPVGTSVVFRMFSFSLFCPVAFCGPLTQLFGLCN